MTAHLDAFDLDDSEFETVDKEAVAKRIDSPIAMSTVKMRGGNAKISLSFSESALARLEGWPRFSISWNKKNNILRVRASVEGAHEAYRLKTGRPSPEPRYILRVPLQEGLKFVEKLREAVPHKYSEDGKTLNLKIPPAFCIVYARPGVPAPEPGEKLSPERLRALAPAPSFGTKR